MIDVICLWVGRLFFILLFITIIYVAYITVYNWAVKHYPHPKLSQKEKVSHVKNWLDKKNIQNFKIIYFEMFNLPSVWWWRPCYRTWRIFRNTWLSDRYIEYVNYYKAHEK